MDECESIINGEDFGIVDGTGSDFVTVVSVGANNKTAADSLDINNSYNDASNSSDYITVLTIGEENIHKDDDCHQIEQVLVYRLPGERLGFGLKFDGGIKASEPVKRLFIQSCAMDSPASRVKSSWGVLVEGDEVLEIDRVPVNNMTRIDCVRCLKDSNVVITLLIRHLGCHIPDSIALRYRINEVATVDNKNKYESDRVPPPPPPVPPRKIPRNGMKKIDAVTRSDSLKKVRRSPECAKRDVVVADGGLCPPDAQIYMDLLSQESLYNLSESDETSSTISTVVDRLSSFPTTSASSLAGSLPSTPTAIRNKRMHLNNVLSSLDSDMHFTNEKDYYLFERLTSLSQLDVENAATLDDSPPVIPPRSDMRDIVVSIASTLQLQHPTNFQDAPLSYGNEDVSVMETTIKTAVQEFVEQQQQQQHMNKKPSPRARQNAPNLKMRQHHQSNQLNIEVEQKCKNDTEVWRKLKDAVNVSDDLHYQKVAVVASWKIRPPPRAKQQQQVYREQNNNRCNNSGADLIIPEALDDKSTNLNNNNNTTIANHNLPRLVDFVPKCGILKDEVIDGKRHTNGNGALVLPQDCANKEENEVGNATWNELECGSGKSSSATQQLATIGEDGEVEETAPPLYIYADDVNNNGTPQEVSVAADVRFNGDLIGLINNVKIIPDFKMASPPIYSRQPPDGREFPDYEERQLQSTRTELESSSDHDEMDSIDTMELQREHQSTTSSDQVSTADTVSNDLIDNEELPPILPQSLPPKSDVMMSTNIELLTEIVRPYVVEQSASTVNQLNGQRCSLDQSLFNYNQQLKSAMTTDIYSSSRTLHGRSQSMEDISKSDRWNQIAEKRQRGFSKLKGLVIPEHVPTEPYQTPSHVYDLPEITSNTEIPTSPSYQQVHITTKVTRAIPSHRSSLNLPSPIWKQQEAHVASSLPKYSPAFKRRSLQLYSSGDLKQHSGPATVAPAAVPTSAGFLYPEIESQPSALTSSSEDGVSSGRNSCLPSLNDSDNDSAFKSCDSLHSLESNNTVQKEIETVNTRNSRPADSPSLSLIFQKNCNKFEQQAGNESSPQAKLPNRANSSGVFGKLDQNLSKANGNANKTNGNIKLKSNICNNASSRVRTIPKSMLSQPTMNVTDLRKKFQALEAVPFVRGNSTPSSTKPLIVVASKSIPSAEKREDSVRTSTSIKQEADQKLSEQDTQAAIKKTLSEFGENLCNEHCSLVILKPEIPGGSLGLTLAGGTDYEAKEITVYSIRPGSAASKDNKLKKGDQILSINGKVMKNLTHANTTALLKESKSEFQIVYCSGIEPVSPLNALPKRNSRSFDLSPTNVIEISDATNANTKSNEERQASSESSVNVTIVKTSAGLGFSIAGGADTPAGDLPLIVKKVFAGGAAEKGGSLRANDELLTIGEMNVTAMSRLDVWTMMKKLPEGPVSLTVRR